jgi:hypothetical protein
MIERGMGVLALVCVAALSGFALHARADDNYISPTNDRLRLTLGAQHVSSTTTLRVDSSAGVPGTQFNAEDVLDLDKSDYEPKFQAAVRVATRHRLIFDYFTLDRSGSTVLTDPLVFKDVIFLVGDPVQSRLDLRTLGIAYAYSFWHSEKLEIAAELGVHATDISAEAKVQTATRHVTQSEDVAGPVPTLGLDATYVFSTRFYIDARYQYLKVNIDHNDGKLAFFDFDAIYRYRPNVALGVGYNGVKANFLSTKTDNAGYVDFNTKGPEFFVRVSF